MKKKIAITIDEEIYSKLSELADKEDRTISGQINKLLKDYFKESKYRLFLFYLNFMFNYCCYIIIVPLNRFSYFVSCIII